MWLLRKVAQFLVLSPESELRFLKACYTADVAETDLCCFSELQEVRGRRLSADGSRLGWLCRFHGSQWEGGVLLTCSEGGVLPAWPAESSDGKTKFVCVEAWRRSCSFTWAVNLTAMSIKNYITQQYKSVFWSWMWRWLRTKHWHQWWIISYKGNLIFV